MKTEPLIQVVDEHNRPIGQATKKEIWEKGLWHRIVRIVAINKNGQMLLQKRSVTKQPAPNCWDTASAGHVDANEDYVDAAQRELHEELGLEGVGLVEIDSYKVSRQREGRTFNCFGKVYCIQLEDTPTQLETEDISEVRWFTPAELKRLVIEHPDQMTEGLRMVLDRNPDLL